MFDIHAHRSAETKSGKQRAFSNIEENGKGEKQMKRKLFAALCTVCFVSLLLPGATGAFAASEESTEMIVGGSLFGVKMMTDGVLVVGLDKVTPEGTEAPRAPAYDCGIRLKDIITEIDGKNVKDSTTVTDSITKSNGKTLELTVKRGADEKHFKLSPVKDEKGIYRGGLWIRDTAAGIGTVTYINEKTGEFAGLGHGICDGETGTLLPIKRGSVSEVELLGIIKGKCGVPGELRGAFSGSKTGALIKNTEMGVYGIFTSVPPSLGEKMKLASPSEVHEGKAFVRSAVAGGTPEDYEIKITSVSKDGKNGKSFAITVTDKKLIALTGGIVQGMSGSPIIQDGKLIGAVTHVLINDPTNGYGIFIENMMNANGTAVMPKTA